MKKKTLAKIIDKGGAIALTLIGIGTAFTTKTISEKITELNTKRIETMTDNLKNIFGLNYKKYNKH